MVSRAPAARLVILALLGAPQVGADEVDFRTDMEGEVTFKNTGVSDVASAMLTETMGIVCYCDWENPEEGKCNAVDFSDSSSPESGPSVLLANFSKNHRFTVARFSDTMGVACYTPFGTVGGKPACLTLSLSGSGSSATLSAGDIFEFDPYSTFSYALSVVSLTDSTGLLCYQDTVAVYSDNRRDVTCLVLEVSGAGLSGAAGVNANKTYANAFEWDNIVDISMAKVSDTSAVVCYADGTEEKALCNRLSLAGSGDELTVGPEFLLGEGLAGSGSDSDWALLNGVLSVAALSEERAVACFCGSEETDGPTCVPLGLDSATEISSVGEALAVGAASCSEVSLVAMSETGAIACYLSGEGGVGTCAGLVLNHGYVLTTGDATEIPASGVASDNSFVEPSACATNECDMWISVSSATGGASAVACYAGVGGSETGRCRGLSIPPPTSTTTATTATETSSTTAHSTTETSSTTATETSTLTSSTTATSTTVTTTTETSSTTPHTTTATETSTTTLTLGPELSGARAAGYAVALIGALTPLLV